MKSHGRIYYCQKTIWLILFNTLILACKKINTSTEAIILRPILTKTILKNHTSGIDYIIKNNLDLSTELIIEKGVEIAVENASKITVLDSGTLTILGEKNSTVVIKGLNNQGWAGIVFYSKNKCTLQHCEVFNASDGNYCIGLSKFANILIENLSISDAKNAAGLAFEAGAKIEIVDKITVNNCKALAQIDLFFTLNFSEKLNSNNVEYKACILKNFNNAKIDINSTTLLKNNGLPYLLDEQIFIKNGFLIIQPGNEILLDNNASILTQYGSKNGFICNGTPSAPIKFKCANAQSYCYGIILDNGENSIKNTIFEITTGKESGIPIIFNKNTSSTIVQFCDFTKCTNTCVIYSSTGSTINADVVSANKFLTKTPVCK